MIKFKCGNCGYVVNAKTFPKTWRVVKEDKTNLVCSLCVAREAFNSKYRVFTCNGCPTLCKLKIHHDPRDGYNHSVFQYRHFSFDQLRTLDNYTEDNEPIMFIKRIIEEAHSSLCEYFPLLISREIAQ